MKILINASTVKYSGGLAVTLSIIDAFRHYPDVLLCIVAPRVAYYTTYAPENSRIKWVHHLFLIKGFRWYLDHIWLPRQIEKISPDVVLSMGNLPAITGYKQIFYHDNPFFTCSSLKNLKMSFREKVLHNLRNKAAGKRINKVSGVIAQTTYEAGKLNSLYPALKVDVIPPFLPVFQKNVESLSPVFHELSPAKKNILCFAHDYPHKNIEILFQVARLFKQNKSPYKIIISSKRNRRMSGKTEQLKEYIAILEKRTLDDTYRILPKVDAIILPSLLESFSLNYIEAWHFNKPLFVSDREFTRNVCGNAAIYFDPASAKDIYTKIVSAFETNAFENIIEQGRIRLNILPGWETVAEYVLKAGDYD